MGRAGMSGASLAHVWQGPAPQALEDDLVNLDATIVDPFDT